MQAPRSDTPPRALSNLAEVYWPLVEMRPGFPGAPLILIAPDWREREPPSGPAARLLQKHLGDAATILDVGAGDRYWGDVLRRLGISAQYRSADLDTRHEHEFGDFLSIDERVDAVLMLELIEHLPAELGLRFIEHAIELLNPGGMLVIGTPNAHHANWTWRTCFTHVRPWPMQDLWAICTLGGLAPVEVYRQMLVSRRRRAVLPAQRLVSKLLGLDVAQGIVVFARKPL